VPGSRPSPPGQRATAVQVEEAPGTSCRFRRTPRGGRTVVTRRSFGSQAPPSFLSRDSWPGCLHLGRAVCGPIASDRLATPLGKSRMADIRGQPRMSPERRSPFRSQVWSNSDSVTERVDSVLTCGGRGRLGPCDRSLATWHAEVATSRHDGRMWLENGLLSSRVAGRSQFVVWIRPHREPRGTARGCRGPSGSRRTWAATSAGFFASRASELPKPGSRIGGQPLIQLQDGGSDRASSPAGGNIGGHREETGADGCRCRAEHLAPFGGVDRTASDAAGHPFGVVPRVSVSCRRRTGLVASGLTAWCTRVSPHLAPETIRCRRICLRIYRRGIRGPSPAGGNIGWRAGPSGILGSRGLRVERVPRGGSRFAKVACHPSGSFASMKSNGASRKGCFRGPSWRGWLFRGAKYGASEACVGDETGNGRVIPKAVTDVSIVL